MRNRSVMWNYFDRNPNNTKFDKSATCKICQKVMKYTSTSHNLKSHLIRTHPGTLVNEDNSVSEIKWYSEPKKRNNKNKIWGFFTLTGEHDSLAKCNICEKYRRYDGSSTSNLAKHLKGIHPEAYERWLNNEPPDIDDSSQDNEWVLEAEGAEGGGNDSDSDSPKTDEVLWGFFELLDARKARCVVCRTTVGSKDSDLRTHLKNQHPKLLAHDSQDNNRQSEDSDGSVQGGDDNAYTEVVYLEDALRDIPVSETNKLKRKSTAYRPRHINISDTPKHFKPDDDDELTAFLKYITVLLKKLTPEVFGKIQLDIVNVIMNANSKYGAAVLQSANNSYVELQKTNVITVNEVSGSNGHNYSITVAPCTSKSVEPNAVSNNDTVNETIES